MQNAEPPRGKDVSLSLSTHTHTLSLSLSLSLSHTHTHTHAHKQVRTYSHEMLPRPPDPPLTTDQVLEKTAVLLEQFELMLRYKASKVLYFHTKGL